MIRPATSADADRLHAMTSALSFRGPVPRAVLDAELAGSLTDDRSILLVAEADGDVVGYLLGCRAPMFVYGGLAFLQELFVEPDHRGRGLGRDLVERFEEIAAAAGAGMAALATRRAGPFYERLGWEPSATYYRRTLGAPPG